MHSEASVMQNKKVKNGGSKISAQTLSIHINSSMKLLSNQWLVMVDATLKFKFA